MHFKRHELKYYINPLQAERLQQQLSALMQLDSNAANADGYSGAQPVF